MRKKIKKKQSLLPIVLTVYSILLYVKIIRDYQYKVIIKSYKYTI